MINNLWKNWVRSEREQLVRNIIDDPDDTSRLVYADWISENQPHREKYAEFIRVSTKIRREARTVRAAELMRRNSIIYQHIWNSVMERVSSLKNPPYVIGDDRGMIELKAHQLLVGTIIDEGLLGEFDLSEVSVVNLLTINQFKTTSTHVTITRRPDYGLCIGLNAFVFDIMVEDIPTQGMMECLPINSVDLELDKWFKIVSRAYSIYNIRNYEKIQITNWKEETHDGAWRA